MGRLIGMDLMIGNILGIWDPIIGYIFVIMAYLVLPTGLARLFRQRWLTILKSYHAWLLILALLCVNDEASAGMLLIVGLFYTTLIIPFFGIIVSLFNRLNQKKDEQADGKRKTILKFCLVWILIFTLWALSLGQTQFGAILIMALFATVFIVPFFRMLISVVTSLFNQKRDEPADEK